jgi:hypothetical protein
VTSRSKSGESYPRSADFLLQRLQQENQRRILGKLLHDLRNPVHSLRITIELFARLARRSGDMDALMDRAARYVEPAEASLQALMTVTDRFGLYLSPPAAPERRAVDVHATLAEIALLLGGAGHTNRVELGLQNAADGSPLRIEGDRYRLSHVLLQLCNPDEGTPRVSASEEGDSVRIEVLTEAPRRAGDFTAEELKRVIEDAGGELRLEANRAALTFRRSARGPG